MDKNLNQAAYQPPYLPLIYICAPYGGDVKTNVKRAAEFAAFAFREGNIPVTQHLLFPFMDDSDPGQRKLAMHMDIVLMGKCSEVWVLGDRITEGMAAEIDRAKRRRQPVRYFTDGFKEA
jgi:hypothetical protein